MLNYFTECPNLHPEPAHKRNQRKVLPRQRQRELRSDIIKVPRALIQRSRNTEAKGFGR